MRVASVDEFVDVVVKFVMCLFVDVHHVAALVILEAHVLADFGFQTHVIDRGLDPVEGRGKVIVAANDEQLEVGFLRHGCAQDFGDRGVAGLVPGLHVGGDRVIRLAFPFQIAMQVILKGGDERALIGSLARIVFVAFAGGIGIASGKARVETAHRYSAYRAAVP